MKRINLTKVPHSYKVGDTCPAIAPNIVEDSLFIEDDKIVGFYLKKMPENMCKVADFCDKELRSKNVPKSLMARSSAVMAADRSEGVSQYSTIIGSIPPKPHMRRPYPSISSVHNVKSAHNFIKGMKLLAKLSADLIKELAPEVYKQQIELIKQNVPEKYRFSDMFTSSISNFNIAADFHVDKANIIGCVNVIIAKRKSADGGHTTIPDYGATVASYDNSMLVYPAWKNLHAVTPIVKQVEKGYRNTLVFYPLKSFKGY